jgi:hypothetical protein
MPEKHFQTPRIVEPGSRGRLGWIAVLLLLTGVAAWFAYDYGRQSAGYFSNRSEAEYQALKQRLEAASRECDQQRELAARYQRASEIDRQAVAEVRERLKVLQAERARLRDKVSFLNSLVSGKTAALEVSDLKLRRDEDSNEYVVSFLVSQRAKGDQRVSGRLEIRVAGQLAGKATVIEPGKLGLKQPLKMGFRHFQKFEARLKLPAGFIPRELLVIGHPQGEVFKPFERRLKWQVGST